MSLIAPGSPYVEIPEAEHHVMIDQPLAYVAALRALLAAWPRRRRRDPVPQSDRWAASVANAMIFRHPDGVAD